MQKLLIIALSTLVLQSLALPLFAATNLDQSTHPDNHTDADTNTAAILLPTIANLLPNYADVILNGEQSATPAARAALLMTRKMTTEREIIKGSCWDFLNAAFRRANLVRKTVFKGAYKHPPYADTEQIQPGDWLYYVNYSYKQIEHSGLFVGWLDKPKKIGLILSYAGEGRHEPARYQAYDLSSVYNIMRPDFKETDPKATL